MSRRSRFDRWLDLMFRFAAGYTIATSLLDRDWTLAVWAVVALAFFELLGHERRRPPMYRTQLTVTIPEGMDEREVANRVRDALRKHLGYL